MNSIKYLRKYQFYAYFQKIEDNETSPNLFCEGTLSFISKPDKDLTRKKVLISLMNIDIKILTKILENQIQKYSFKEDNTSGPDGVYSGSEEFNI